MNFVYFACFNSLSSTNVAWKMAQGNKACLLSIKMVVVGVKFDNAEHDCYDYGKEISFRRF